MRDNKIVVVLDWEFANFQSLSMMLNGNNPGTREIMCMTEVAEARGWERSKIELQLGDGNPTLMRRRARCIQHNLGMRTTTMGTATKHENVIPKASFGLDGQIRLNCQARQYHIPSISSNIARNKHKGPASTPLSIFSKILRLLNQLRSAT
jgi:hypothetical protein